MAAKLRMEIESDRTIIVPPPPQRFNLDEWYRNNQFRYRCSEQQQQLADRLLAESDRICEVTTEVAKKNKEETDWRLKERLEDIKFHKQELLCIRKEIFQELGELSAYKERLTSALTSVRRNALLICQKCLTARERRLGIDLIYDNVERELRKECEVIQGVDNLLLRTLEQSNEQIRRLKASLYFMDHNLEDKDSNLRIDHRNLTLKETSLNLSLYHGTAPLDLSNITLNEWEMQTNNSVIEAAKEMNSGKTLCSFINTILKQTVDDLIFQKNATEEAFRRRIQETIEAKVKLELQHSEIMRQANEMTRNITRIQKSIAEKEGFMALAHTRLGNRCQRTGSELTCDLVGTCLVNEVYDLRQIVSNLQEMLCEAQASLRYLLKTQIQLEEDINIKTNTLKIDEVECMTLRQSMEYHSY